MTNLWKIRKKRRLSQVKLQIETGIDQSLISKFERGERQPTAQMLMILADYFHVSTDYLLDRTDVETPYPPKSVIL